MQLPDRHCESLPQISLLFFWIKQAPLEQYSPVAQGFAASHTGAFGTSVIVNSTTAGSSVAA